MVVVDVVAVLVALAVLYVLSGARVVNQYERALVFRLGRLRAVVRKPGFNLVIPVVDRMLKVNMQIVTHADARPRRASPATT